MHFVIYLQMQIELFLTENHHDLNIWTVQFISIAAPRIRQERYVLAGCFPYCLRKHPENPRSQGSSPSHQSPERQMLPLMWPPSSEDTSHWILRIPTVWYSLNNKRSENQEDADPSRCIALGTSVLDATLGYWRPVFLWMDIQVCLPAMQCEFQQFARGLTRLWFKIGSVLIKTSYWDRPRRNTCFFNIQKYSCLQVFWPRSSEPWSL